MLAGFRACRHRMNVPGIGIIHAGSGSLLKTRGEGEMQGPGHVARVTSDKRRRSGPLENANGCKGTACPPDSVEHPSGMRPCRESGSPAMSVPAKRYQGYRAAGRTPGGRKVPAAFERHEISTSCVAFRAARSRSLRPRITRDSCLYRA